MNQYDFHLDYTDAMTMIKLGRYVRLRIAQGVPFTEANKIHISGMQDELTSTQIDRKTQLRYLGLLAKVKDQDGRHKDSLWAITSWGFAFLRGESVSKTVRVWRKKIIERSEIGTTIAEALASGRSSLAEQSWDTRCFDAISHDGIIA